MGIAFMTLSMVVYIVHVTCQDIDGGTSIPVGLIVATPDHCYQWQILLPCYPLIVNMTAFINKAIPIGYKYGTALRQRRTRV